MVSHELKIQVGGMMCPNSDDLYFEQTAREAFWHFIMRNKVFIHVGG